MDVRLSNMGANDPAIRLTGVDLSAPYQSGLDGGSDYATTADFEFDLTDGVTTWSGEYDDVNVAFIYQKGVDDATPTNYRWLYATGNNNNVNVRKTPSGDTTNLLGRVYCNTRVEFIGTSGSYVQIRYEGYTGYVSSSLVHTSKKSGVTEVTSGWAQAPGGGDQPDPTKIVDYYMAISACHNSEDYSHDVPVFIQMRGDSSHARYTSTTTPVSTYISRYNAAEKNTSNVTDVYHDSRNLSTNLQVIVTYWIVYTDGTHDEHSAVVTSEAF